MFRRETQSLLKARAKALEKAEQRVEDLVEENRQLREIRIDAEHRATKYARAVRKIEIILNEKGQGSIVDRNDKIKEVLSDLANQL